jgi:GNAT superfamily N-acetyltransferase
MNNSRRFAIVFSPESAKRVSNYVVRGFFGLRELPQAFARMVLTGEFALFVGIPVVLLIVAKWVAGGVFSADAEIISSWLTGVAVVWLIAGLVRISLYGPSRGIGCYPIESDGSIGALVGGLRMRLEHRNRRIWIAGILVEPRWRGAAIGTALMRAALQLAQDEASHGPVIVSVFAPTHPASKAIIARHLGGKQSMTVSSPPSEELLRTIERLDDALKKSGSVFQWPLTPPEHVLFRNSRR